MKNQELMLALFIALGAVLVTGLKQYQCSKKRMQRGNQARRIRKVGFGFVRLTQMEKKGVVG
jgi:hypothetical protein